MPVKDVYGLAPERGVVGTKYKDRSQTNQSCRGYSRGVFEVAEVFGERANRVQWTVPVLVSSPP